MTDNLKEKVSKYIYDYYIRFDDNEITIRDDGISIDFRTYGIDDILGNVDKEVILSYGSLVFYEDGKVLLITNDIFLGYSATIVFVDWNHFIEYKKVTSNGIDDCYMNWDSYIL